MEVEVQHDRAEEIKKDQIIKKIKMEGKNFSRTMRSLCSLTRLRKSLSKDAEDEPLKSRKFRKVPSSLRKLREKLCSSQKRFKRKTFNKKQRRVKSRDEKGKKVNQVAIKIIKYLWYNSNNELVNKGNVSYKQNVKKLRKSVDLKQEPPMPEEIQ